MPCYQIITQSVDLSKCGDVSLLRDSITELDVSGQLRGCWYDYANKCLNGPKDVVGKVADKIKRAYSEKSIYKSAKKQGWTVKKVSQNKFQVIRRY